jgi:hypothetical protein
MARQMSKAFDVYLSILKTVESQLDKAFGHNLPDWWLKNICLCCMHKVEGEQELAHGILTTVNSNNSLKLVDGSYRRGEMAKDLHIGSADFWLDKDFINRFKDEVPSKVKGKRKGKAKAKETVVEVVVEGDQERVPTEEDDQDEHWVDEEKDTTSQFQKVLHEVDNPVPGVKLGCVDR